MKPLFVKTLDYAKSFQIYKSEDAVHEARQ